MSGGPEAPACCRGSRQGRYGCVPQRTPGHLACRLHTRFAFLGKAQEDRELGSQQPLSGLGQAPCVRGMSPRPLGTTGTQHLSSTFQQSGQARESPATTDRTQSLEEEIPHRERLRLYGSAEHNLGKYFSPKTSADGWHPGSAARIWWEGGSLGRGTDLCGRPAATPASDPSRDPAPSQALSSTPRASPRRGKLRHGGGRSFFQGPGHAHSSCLPCISATNQKTSGGSAVEPPRRRGRPSWTWGL